MNAFREHHQHSIRFHYRCFDRILLNGIIPAVPAGRAGGRFFEHLSPGVSVSRDVLRDIAAQFHNWVKNRSQRWDVPILDAPVGRRDEFVDPYFKRAKTDAVACIVKCREPARILTRDNLIFSRRAALDALGERLLDANRTIGQPNKLTVILGTGSPNGTEASCRR